MKLRIAFVFVALVFGFQARAADLPIDSFTTIYCGTYNVAQGFACNDITRSSFIRRICYDQRRDLMLIKLNERGYCYCGLGAAKIDEFLKAASMGRFYNAEIKGSFHCPQDSRSNR